MQQARATHTTFAIAWIYLAAISVVYAFMEQNESLCTPAWRRRAQIQMVLWVAAGAGALISFMLKIFSGREYVEYHPALSLLIYIGWVLFFVNLINHTCRNFWQAPVYIFLWVVGAALFLVTYFEAHLWYLAALADFSVADMQIQWKSVGTMAGSFNMLVYGSGIFLAEKISGTTAYARSRTAFALFWIGLLNSFTNYTHHTYTLPQDNLVKWIGFAVSMLEILILFRVVSDLLQKCESAPANDSRMFLRCSKWWTAANLALAIAMSVPALNVLFHGTHVVVAHAMGTTIGIDTLILFGASSWLLQGYPRAPRALPLLVTSSLNLALSIFLGSLLVLGYSNAIAHFFGGDNSVKPWAIAGMCLGGALLSLVIAGLVLRWMLALSALLFSANSSSARSLPPLDSAVKPL